MSKVTTLQLTIEDVDVRGPFDGKYGKFDTHVYTANGDEYVKFVKTDTQPEASAGETILVEVETKTTDRGIQNKITKLAHITKTNKPDTKPNMDLKTTLVGKKTTSNVGTLTATSTSKKTPIQPKEVSMARMNGLTNSVNLLTLIGSKDVSPEKVMELAQRFADFTTAPFN